MSVVIVTGSAGLIGSEAVRFFAKLGMHVVGIDNDMRQVFFGESTSTHWQRQQLETELGNRSELVQIMVDADLEMMGLDSPGKGKKTVAQKYDDWHCWSAQAVSMEI